MKGGPTVHAQTRTGAVGWLVLSLKGSHPSHPKLRKETGGRMHWSFTCASVACSWSEKTTFHVLSALLFFFFSCFSCLLSFFLFFSSCFWFNRNSFLDCYGSQSPSRLTSIPPPPPASFTTFTTSYLLLCSVLLASSLFFLGLLSSRSSPHKHSTKKNPADAQLWHEYYADNHFPFDVLMTF